MAQVTFVASSTPVAVTTSAVPTYPAGLQAADLITLYVASDSSGIGAPGNGFIQQGSTVTGSGVSVAVYTKTANGSEAGNITIPVTGGTSGVAFMAARRPPPGFAATAALVTSGTDTDTTSTAYSATGASRALATDDVLVAFTAGLAAASGAFTAGLASLSLTSAGATLGAGTSRVGGRTSANTLAYNLYDKPATAGATGAPTFAATAAGANIGGATVFLAIRVTAANTPPTSAATVPASATASATYTVTDASTVGTAGANITGRTWRIISGGGSLSSTTASSVTVTAPAVAGTQVIGITATDSNGLAGAEATYSVTVNAGAQPNAGPAQTVESLDTVTLAGSGTNTPTTWQWRQISGTTITLSSTTAQGPTFKAPATISGATIALGLKVGNGSIAAGATEDTVTVTVRPHIEWAVTGGTTQPIKILAL